MHFKGQGGLKIAADVWGSDKESLVILLHGGGQTRHAWGETGKKLSEAGYHSVAIDLRGHGDSEWHSDGDYSISAYKQDLISIIKEIGKPACLVGASLGGMASLLLAGDKKNANLCTALVMVDIGIYPDPVGADRIVSFMLSGKNGFKSLEDVAKSICNFLGLEYDFEYETVQVGSNYPNRIIETLPDQVVDVKAMNIDSIIVRMDYLFNEEILIQQLNMGKVSVVTDKPIDEKIIQAHKPSLKEVIYFITKETGFRVNKCFKVFRI